MATWQREKLTNPVDLKFDKNTGKVYGEFTVDGSVEYRPLQE